MALIRFMARVSRPTAALSLLLVLSLWVLPARGGGLIDGAGRRVEVPDQPGRIIGLMPSLTEVLFALGLEGLVVGATRWADYPTRARELPRVGSYVSPNLERIVSLKPDLVLADWEGNPPQVVEKLEEAGIPVYVTRSDDPYTLPADLARLGAVCGVPEKGRVLAEKMQAQFDQVANRLKGAKRVKTLLVIETRPLVSAGSETIHGKLLTMLQAENVAAGAPGHWPRLSLEYVVEMCPELVVVTTMERDSDRERLLEYWRKMPGIGDRPGLRVRSIDSNLIDRPGPRLGRGVEELGRIIHPDRFNRKDPGR